jgi:hypothetical protein
MRAPEVAGIDPVPEWVRMLGHSMFDHRDASIAVADLASDSLVDGDASADVRVVRFAHDGRAVTLSITRGHSTVALGVEVTPPDAVLVELRPLHGSARQDHTDGTGVATYDSVPTGALSVLVHWPDEAGGPVRTAWVQV